MGTLTEEINCLQCGGKAFKETYKTNEIYEYCPICGYAKEVSRLKKNEKIEDLELDGWVIYKIEGITQKLRITQGTGTIKFAMKNGRSQVLPFNGNVTKEHMPQYIKYLHNSKFDTNRCYITLWDRKENRLEVVFGNTSD